MEHSLIEQAAMNTAMGMGTVFVVLILISVLIYCFRIIPYLKGKMGKKDVPAVDPETYMDKRLSVPVATEKDDLELVAVIMAAIAASEYMSTDDFIVRSIVRRY